MCRFKQDERRARIRGLVQRDPRFGDAVTEEEKDLLNMPIEKITADVHGNRINPADLILAYGKVALRANEKTNCLTEIMVDKALEWIKDGSINLRGPLAGIPISIKDTLWVGGFDASLGYSSFAGNPLEHDGASVRLLKDMGAVPYVKTNVPITLLSFESTNDIWGRCTNPYNCNYSPGGSTGGEAALLAMGGRIGIGSDVAGSVRVPAHFSGCYSLKCSTGRWPKLGASTSMPGQEGVPAVQSPMSRTMNDLVYFTKSAIEMCPWKYDYTVHPLAWREEQYTEFASGKKKLKVGVMRTDGVVGPSPACSRALEMVETALRREGHEIAEIEPPSPYEGLVLASILLNADGCRTFRSFMKAGEWLDEGAQQMACFMDLPRPFKYVYYLWVKYVRRDLVWAGIVRNWSEKSLFENWNLVAQREAYKLKWFEWWNKQQIDCIIAPPNATPAVPHGGMKHAVSSCGYTFLFNLVRLVGRKIPNGLQIEASRHFTSLTTDIICTSSTTRPASFLLHTLIKTWISFHQASISKG